MIFFIIFLLFARGCPGLFLVVQLHISFLLDTILLYASNWLIEKPGSTWFFTKYHTIISHKHSDGLGSKLLFRVRLPSLAPNRNPLKIKGLHCKPLKIKAFSRFHFFSILFNIFQKTVFFLKNITRKYHTKSLTRLLK